MRKGDLEGKSVEKYRPELPGLLPLHHRVYGNKSYSRAMMGIVCSLDDPAASKVKRTARPAKPCNPADLLPLQLALNLGALIRRIAKQVTAIAGRENILPVKL
jgi:hypothetical protein